MAIAEKRSYSVDLQKGAEHAVLRAPLATMDNQAHIFEVQVNDGGAAADLSGAVCEAYFIRADGVTVMLDGVVSGSIASVTLGANCYAVPGRFELAVKLTQGDTVHTILRVEGSVTTSRTDAMTGAGSGVHSFDQLEGKIDAALNGLSQRDRVRNLLDNSDFTNPVNQRGASSYTGSGYTIDRWKMGSPASALTINDASISVGNDGSGEGYIRQIIDNGHKMLAGKAVTLACELADGRIYVASGTFPETLPASTTSVAWISLPTGRFVLYANSSIGGFVQATATAGNSIELVWAALYPGEYTAETLPAYVPKGYAHEWQECRRYYQYHGYACVSMIALSGAKLMDSTYAFLDGSMRTIPAVTGTLIRIYGQGTANESPDSGYTLSFSGNSLRVSYPSAITNVTTLQIYGVYFSDLAFDAEL